MPGYRGRRVSIVSFIDPEPIKFGVGKWIQRVKLECGHDGKLTTWSKYHRRSRPAKAAFCTICLPRDRHEQERIAKRAADARA
jgi:hypothetical protein